MKEISDEYMQQMLATVKPYTLVILQQGAANAGDVQALIWEHGRRNFALREEGKINIVSPVTHEADVAGIYMFNTSAEDADAIMKDDPCVKAGIFSYKVYSCMSFPGDCLK